MGLMNGDLFADDLRDLPLAPEAWLLGGFARDRAPRLVQEIQRIVLAAPWRHILTPGGRRMSVAMTNCGDVGWVSDMSGYRYAASDPETGQPWPPMPDAFRELAVSAAARAGFDGYRPDACLINRYEPGAKMSLHQDRDERDLVAPIVSVSLGLPATFLFGGLRRADPTRRVPLWHGDVVVWGGESRLRYHGVLPVEEGEHPLVGRWRMNLTFRKVAAG